MATTSLDSGAVGAHAKTLSANAVDTVHFADDLKFVEVVSDGAAELYFTVDDSAPTVGGQASYYLPAIASPSATPAAAAKTLPHPSLLPSPTTYPAQ